MSYPHEIAANMILSNLHLAEAGLEGREIVTVTGLRGIVRRVKLHDHHGLVFTIEEHHAHTERRWLPVALIREIIGYAEAA
jgi:hypothetical protein